MNTRVYYDGTRHFTDGKIRSSFGAGRYSSGWSNRAPAARPCYKSTRPTLSSTCRLFIWTGTVVRCGCSTANLVIAWGEAYFFRSMDVAIGLDLRRHLSLAPGAEAYQGQHIAAPGVRLSPTFSNGYQLDAFAQLFSPTIKRRPALFLDVWAEFTEAIPSPPPGAEKQLQQAQVGDPSKHVRPHLMQAMQHFAARTISRQVSRLHNAHCTAAIFRDENPYFCAAKLAVWVSFQGPLCEAELANF